MNRRNFLNIAIYTSSGIMISGSLNSCMGTHKPGIINKIWNEKFDFKTDNQLLRIMQLIRCGIMAPSSYNNQPWLFKINDNIIEIIPDLKRKLSVADPKNRELYISLGCCLQNILIAAPMFRFDAEYSIEDLNNEKKIIIQLNETGKTYSIDDSLFKLIKDRRTTRSEYAKTSISPETFKALTKIEDESSLFSIIREQNEIDRFFNYQKESNRLLFNNKNYTDEIKSWLRYSDKEAEEKMDGLYSRALGESATSEWLGNIYFNLTVTPETQDKLDFKLINNSSGLILFFANDVIKDWINSGMQIQNLLLKIAKAGLKYSFLAQISRTEVLRKDFSSDFGHKGLFPQTAIRIGYADYLPRSPRRPVKDFVLK